MSINENKLEFEFQVFSAQCDPCDRRNRHGVQAGYHRSSGNCLASWVLAINL